MTDLKQGTKVKIKEGNSQDGCTGIIVGKGPTSNFGNGASYVIQPDKPIEYCPYSTLVLYECQFDVNEDEPLIMPDNAFTAEDARTRTANSEATYAQAYTNMLKAIFTAIDTACMIKDSNYARLVFGAEYTDVVSHELMYKIQEDLEEMGYEMSFNFSDYFDIWIWW